jgi:hypothetical protein
MSAIYRDPNDPRPVVTVRLPGRTLAGALYDTGACVSLISEEAYLRIPHWLRPERSEGPWMRLTGADNKAMEIKGRFKLKMKIQQRTLYETVYVVPRLTSDLIIGIDIIHKSVMSYDAKKKRPFFQDTSDWEEGGILVAEETKKESCNYLKQ